MNRLACTLLAILLPTLIQSCVLAQGGPYTETIVTIAEGEGASFEDAIVEFAEQDFFIRDIVGTTCSQFGVRVMIRADPMEFGKSNITGAWYVRTRIVVTITGSPGGVYSVLSVLDHLLPPYFGTDL
ncbi:MAG: hypothetical protein AAF456_08595 [Planctomycetota bacterium]